MMHSEPASHASVDTSLVQETLDKAYPGLSFPNALEQAFEQERYKILLRRAPVIALYVMGMLVFYCFSDYAFLPPSVHEITIGIRVLVIAPALLFVVWCGYRRWPYKQYQAIYTGVYLIGGLSIVAIILVARLQHVPMPYEGILLITFLGYLIMGIPFYHALWVSVSLFFTYVLGEYFVGYPLKDLAYNAFFLLTANVIGAVGCYMHEHTQRIGFLNRLLVEKSRDEAEQENESKTRLLAVASHDLRQPLHAMTLFAENLEQKLPDGETKQSVLHIQSSIRHLNQLLSSLLDMSRLQFGVIHPQVKAFDLYPLVEQVIRETNHRGRTLVKVEALQGAYWVESDALLMARILRNLIDNALEHADAEAIEVKIFADKGQTIIHISDNGIGISEANLAKIFDEFHQVKDGPKAGLGLGLSIVKQMSTLLGHDLEVHSGEGEGTQFSLTVPSANQVETDVALAHAVGESKSDCRILVAEDMPEVLSKLAELVRSWGYSVEEAATVDDAIDFLDKGGFNLIITDYHFGAERDGLDLVKEARRRQSKLPVIMLTADSTVDLDEDGLSNVIITYKPIKPAKLRLMIRQVL